MNILARPVMAERRGLRFNSGSADWRLHVSVVVWDWFRQLLGHKQSCSSHDEWGDYRDSEHVPSHINHGHVESNRFRLRDGRWFAYHDAAVVHVESGNHAHPSGQ